MKHNFSYYYKKAQSLNSFVNAKSKSSAFKRALFLLISFVGKLFIFTRPIFAVADNNYLAMIEKTHNFSFLKIFEGCTKKDKYLSLLGSYMVADIVFATLIVAISFPCLYAIATYPSMTAVVQILLLVLSIVPIFIGLALYPNIAGLGFLGHKTSEFDMGDYLYASIEGVKGIKGTIFGITFLNLVIIYILWILPFNLYVPLTNMIYDVAPFVLIGLLFITFILYVFVFSNMFMDFRMAFYLYFEDNMVVERTVVVKQNPGTKITYTPLFKDEVSGKEKE